jgi:hypothetical protein
MDVSSIATAYTAFSEVLVGFARGTESHSGQRNTSALVAPGLPGSGRRALLPTLSDLVASVPRRPATQRYRPAGPAGHDNGQTQPRRSRSALPATSGQANYPPVRRGIRCMAEWLAVSAELADLGAPAARLRTSQMLILPGLHAESAEIIRHCR